MAKVEGVAEVASALKAKAKSVGGNVSCIVGYSQRYSIFVHENLEAVHPVGQAKFLEQPAREYATVLGDIVKKALAAGKTMAQSLLLAGLRLQRESQQLCPVLTGNLKASAFVRVEQEG